MLRVLYPSCGLDEDFASNSVFYTDNAFDSEFVDVAVDSLLRVVLAGKESFVVRLDDDGVADSFFGVDGLRELPDIGEVSAVALQPDDRIVLAQSATGVFNVRRLVTTGGDDSSFSGDGLFTYHTLVGGSGPMDVLIEPDTGAVARIWRSLIFTDGFERINSTAWSRTQPSQP